MDTSDTIAKYQKYAPSKLGPRRATVILATKLGSSSRAEDISFAEQSDASGVVSMPLYDSRKKPAILFGACAVITRTKTLSFAPSKVSAVELTSPVMDNDDYKPYCRLLQLASKNELPRNWTLNCDANIRSYDCKILRERWISCL